MVKHGFWKKTRLQIDPEIYQKSITNRVRKNDAKREEQLSKRAPEWLPKLINIDKKT